MCSQIRVYPARKKARRGGSTAPVAAIPSRIIGYARVSTNEQALPAQRNGLASLGVLADGICVVHGVTGRNRKRPGLREALVAV